MTVLETIQTRHSVQRYINTPLPEEVVATLQQKIEEINTESGLHIQLVTNEPKVCSVMALFSRVENYFIIAGPKSNNLDEKVGYHGE